MTRLPQEILTAWTAKSGAPVMTSVDKNGTANSIYATCVSIYNDEKILVANNYFDKTLKIIKDGCKGGFLFITDENKAYQLKGTYTYLTEGPEFDDMKSWNPSKHPGHGVAVLKIEEIYSGSRKIL